MVDNKQKKNRHKEIYKILEDSNLRTHDEIVEELMMRNIKTSQPTVKRDLDEIGITRDDEGFYKPSDKTQKKFHIDTIHDLLFANRSSICTNVKTFFLNTEEGKAQETAYHLEQAFRNMILKTLIGLDYVIILVDESEISDDFLNLFEQQE